MNRRGFFAALAAVPTVAGAPKPKERQTPEPVLENFDSYEDWLKAEMRWIAWREQMSARVLL